MTTHATTASSCECETVGTALPDIEVQDRRPRDRRGSARRRARARSARRGYYVMKGYYKMPDADRHGHRRRRLAPHRRPRHGGRERLLPRSPGASRT
ncbi:MAG: hypothetical protein MZV49_09645 [Rhodopseudomonas palustris]|nr:hypothetical protein [Rhodopseudomonas palustris]